LFIPPFRSEDDEDEEANDANAPPAETAEPPVQEVGEEGDDGEVRVKPDPEGPKKKQESSIDLYVYSESELKAFRQKELLADTELLDGT
jgi:structural maintenance of chromosome 4